MENIKMQQNEDGNETIDAFPSVMGSKHPECLRFYGIGESGTFEASSNATNKLVKKIIERMLRMEKKTEELKEQFDEQKTMMRQEILEDVITKLHRSGLPIDVNVLATLLDASSTREIAIRSIHRSSIRSNNQEIAIRSIHRSSIRSNNQGKNPPSCSSNSSTTAFATSCLLQLHLFLIC
ncbi:hypothetical protein H5410_031568 [Solanum commersonii]|uniref:Uncharacterized protein n=1 Tax=Solanum commersonii TaxID=4109 RepID=A0A9J5YMR4_SOLCO|nr:hypothetical protein H5410_031568 [Solanum commersonii]